jgi:hypothetical protein
MEITYNELKMMRGLLRLKRMYKDMKFIPHGVVVWEDWMEESLEKVEKELYRINPKTPRWR